MTLTRVNTNGITEIDKTKISGTAITAADTGTVTSAMIADGQVTSAKIADATIVNQDVSLTAAIAGTKVSPDFGSQTVTTTGTSTAASFIPTSSSVPANGVYLPGANSLGLATASTERVRVTSAGLVGIGTTSPGRLLQVSNTSADPFVSILGAASNNGGLLFGDNASDAVGQIRYDHSVDAMYFATNSSERARIDSSGRLLVGTSTARTNTFNASVSQIFQIEGIGDTNRGAGIFSSVAGESGAYLLLGHQRSGAVGGNTAIVSGDDLGLISFQGSDGTEFVEGARIAAIADAGVSANDMPTRLAFSTCGDGASLPAVRFTIASNGDHRFSNTNDVHPQPDNAVRLGFSGGRWSAVWAATGTIQTSDGRAKTEVTNAVLGSDFINSLRPVSYKWIEGGKRDTGERDPDGNWIYESVPGTRTHWGFIAQEVKEAVDAAGVDFGGYVLTDKDDPDSQQALRYDQFIAPLTKALQETMAELEALKAEVAALKAA